MANHTGRNAHTATYQEFQYSADGRISMCGKSRGPVMLNTDPSEINCVLDSIDDRL